MAILEWRFGRNKSQWLTIPKNSEAKVLAISEKLCDFDERAPVRRQRRRETTDTKTETMKISTVTTRPLFLLVLLLAGRWTMAATDDPRPDPEPQPLTTTEALAELINATDATVRSEVEALTQVTTTTTTTTTAAPTTTTTTTTTTAAPATVGGINLGGGLLSNAISGGGAGGGGILALLGAGTTEKPKGPTGNFDTYLDTILTNLRGTLRKNGFDPLRLGNMLQCRNCSLEGLSLIRRAGPANLNYVNRTIVVDAFLGLPAIYVTCFPCVEVVLMIPFTGMLEVALWDLQIFGKVSQPTTRGSNPSLDEYKVVREGDLDMSLKGYGLLGPVAEIGFRLGLQRTISMIIREFVYERVPHLIQEQIKGFSFPIGKR